MIFGEWTFKKCITVKKSNITTLKIPDPTQSSRGVVEFNVELSVLEPLTGTEWDKHHSEGENWKQFIYQYI